jgi:hypothetical protein
VTRGSDGPGPPGYIIGGKAQLAATANRPAGAWGSDRARATSGPIELLFVKVRPFVSFTTAEFFMRHDAHATELLAKLRDS